MTTIREQTLEHAYFEWLADQVRPEFSNQTYDELLAKLHHKEFVWTVPNDDNRIADGQDLLAEYITERGIESENVRIEGTGCSFLELVVGLSRRLSFAAGGTPLEWAWHVLGNLGFHSMSDPLTRHNHRYIDEILDQVIWRTYKRDGVGGLFPLRYPREDQRKVELWYQMSAYIEENPID